MSLRFRLLLLLLVLLSGSAYGLFDTGTSLDKGKLEADLCLNPFKDIPGGQSWLFLHYGLGNKYEIHGFLSKHRSIYDWATSANEYYIGILKQWYESDRLDLATAVGWRTVPSSNLNSLIGPGILYTYRWNEKIRIAGHLQYIGNISDGLTIVPYNIGYTSEIGLYYMFTKNFEIAGGVFTNSVGTPRPIYTLNYYF